MKWKQISAYEWRTDASEIRGPLCVDLGAESFRFRASVEQLSTGLHGHAIPDLPTLECAQAAIEAKWRALVAEELALIENGARA